MSMRALWRAMRSGISVVALVAMVHLPLAHAQGGGQVIVGVVTDSTGAVLPNATVTIKEVTTGTSTVLKTNGDGLYRSAPLSPSKYDVMVASAGFQTEIRSGVTLHLGETMRLDLSMKIGQGSQIVNVPGSAPILNTESAAISEVVEQKAISDLPLTDRRAGGLIALGPGVYYEGQDAVSFMAPRFTIAGNGDVALFLDGAPNAAPRTSVDQMGVNPPEASLQEVQIQQSYYGAESGGYEGGMVRMETKSGTNLFHGSLYEHARNTIFDTRAYFAQHRQGDHYNLFGGAIGGPIKKDRYFFFTNVEGTRQATPVSGNFTVPTTALTNGDFSALKTPIYDPATTRPDPNNPGKFIRDPFPGNIIPANRFDPVGVKVLSFYPSIIQAGANNLAASWVNGLNRYAWLQKLYFQFSPNDQASFSWLFDHSNLSESGLPGFRSPAAIQDAENLGYKYQLQSYIFNESHTFSPTLVNHVVVAYRSIRHERYSPGLIGGADWPAQLGITNISEPRGFPPFALSGYMGLGTASLGFTQDQQPFSWSEGVTWMHGKHTLSIGMDGLYSWHNISPGNASGGSFTFNPSLTASPGVAKTGDSVASLLLGEVSSASVANSANYTWLEWYVAPYAQDSIHVTRKLTLNVGLRWEIDLPLHEGKNRGSGFDPFTINPVSNTPGVITFQGERGVPFGFYRTDWNRFEPRVGFAYRLSDKTVLRAAYGIYGISPALGSHDAAPTVGFDPANASFSTPDNGLTPAFVLGAGFPTWPAGANPATLNDSFGAVAVGSNPTTSPSFVNPNWQFGYSQNFNLSVQRELPGQIVLEADGIGGLGRRLSITVDRNQVPPGLWGLSGNAQVRRPYPQFGSVSQVDTNGGNTNYYGLATKATKRLSHGLLFIGNFTWQKALGVITYQADAFPKLSYGAVEYDRANAPGAGPYKLFRLTGVYDLPMGSGARWFHSGPASWIFGGWTTSGIFTYDS